MRFTLKDAKIKTTLRERIPFHYNEPDPERHLSIWDSNPSIKSIRSFSESQREKITCVGFSFTKDFPIYIAELKRFPNLRELIFNDCYWVKPAGIDVYCGLSELKNLDTLHFRDSIAIDAKTIKAIASMPNLRSLIIDLQGVSEVTSLAGLKDCMSLEYLELGITKNEVFAEDLAFVSEMNRLRWLVLDGCPQIDVTKFVLPKSLEAFTPPNYGYSAAKKKFSDQCVILKTCGVWPPKKNRFVSRIQKNAAVQAHKSECKVKLSAIRGKRKIMAAIKSIEEGLPLFDYVDKNLSASLKALEGHLADGVSEA